MRSLVVGRGRIEEARPDPLQIGDDGARGKEVIVDRHRRTHRRSHILPQRALRRAARPGHQQSMRCLPLIAAMCLCVSACTVGGGEASSEQSFALATEGPSSAPLLGAEEIEALETALTSAIAAADEAIADLEGQIAGLEVDQQVKASEIETLVGQIEARRSEIEASYQSNQNLCLLCVIIGCPSVCYVSLANMLDDDARLDELDGDLALAHQQQASILQQLAEYRSRRDQLRAELETLRTARTTLVEQLTSGTLTPRPALADYPELADRVARIELLQSVLDNTTDQVSILEEIRTLAQAVDAAFDDALVVLRQLAADADAAAADSRRAILELVELLTAPDPNAAAAAWLEDLVAQKTRALIAAMDWPMTDFITKLLTDRGPTDPAARATLELGLELALGVTEPEPEPEPDNRPILEGYFDVTALYYILDNHTSISPKTIQSKGDLVSLSVWVDIRHTYIGDLDVYLVHDGVTAHLHARTGGNTDDIKRWYNVPELAGHKLEGTWELRVADRATGDTGAINRWHPAFEYRARN
jgi:proprotein convertase P-domain-containing protein